LLALALAAAPGHACAGARPAWLAPGLQHPEAVFNRVTLVGRDEIRWNGVPITRRTLRRYLGLVATMIPPPLTILEPADSVDCALLEAVRDDIEAALPCADGICGEGIGAWTVQEEEPPPPPLVRPIVPRGR
jgi:hypothetical protein